VFENLEPLSEEGRVTVRNRLLRKIGEMWLGRGSSFSCANTRGFGVEGQKKISGEEGGNRVGRKTKTAPRTGRAKRGRQRLRWVFRGACKMVFWGRW